MGAQQSSGRAASRGTRIARGAIAAVAAAALSLGLLAASPPGAQAAPRAGDVLVAAEPTAAEPAGEPSVSSDPLPTAQVNGIVWAQAAARGRVYAGGDFQSARPAGASPGTQLVARQNLLAYDLATGVLVPSFAPQVNGRVLAAAASPDGTRVYIGGAFTAVNGVARYRVAAFDTATGALISSFAPGTNSTVIGIAATNTTVYLAGQFSNVNNTARTGVAAVSAATGQLTAFNPVMTGGYGARGVVVSPDGSKVVVGGSFLTTNGSDSPGRGMAALSATTGASLPWAVNSVIRNAGNNAAIYSLSSDGDSVYGTGYDFGGTKTQDDFEGAFRASWSDGTMVWMEDCHGDTYSAAPLNGNLYTAGHTHYCGNIGEFPQLDPWYLNHSLAFGREPSGRQITPDIWGYRSFTGNPAAKLLHWYPTWSTGNVSGVGQAGWNVIASGGYLLYGGEFTAINGVRQQGLVRFAVRDAAPNKQGPVLQGGSFAVSAVSFRSGEARVLWQANHDTDDATLTYEVYRRGTTAPIDTRTVDSTYWVRPQQRFSDTSVQPGATYEYRVRVSDPSGNATTSNWVAVTVPAAGTTRYADAVFEQDPLHYWPLGEASGTIARDWASGSDVTLTAGTTRGVAGQATDESTRATVFSGGSSSGASAVQEDGPDTFSLEAWFRTTSGEGGKIVGFGDRQTGGSNNYDRHIYLTPEGRVTFGVHPGGVRILQSGAGLNDGGWHHVVGTLSPTGMALYVDGVRMGTSADTTSAQPYRGYWRIGGDNIGGWPNVGAHNLSGTIADVAVYERALTRNEIDAHLVASGRASTVPPVPTDQYGAAVRSLDPTLYWRLDETSGPVAADSGPDGLEGTYLEEGSDRIQRGQPGALTGVDDGAVRFTSNGWDNGWTNRQSVVARRAMAGPTTYAIETWFRTTTSGGGKLVGFGSSDGGWWNASPSHDRHLMMTNEGTLQFGAWNGRTDLVGTSQAYNDGGWHHVVAQQSSSGMQLYVDGALVAQNGVTTAEPFTGYWRVGGDSTWFGDPFWVGTMDEVAIYPTPLTAAQVRAHYELATEGVANVAPTASFTATAQGLRLGVDASASSDPEGGIAAYEWSFGDGTTATGPVVAHDYAEAGDYEVRLTVRDAAGATGTTTRDVSVSPVNQPPVAAFEAVVDGLGVSVDASASSDPEGAIASYSWAWGDGTSGSGSTATHDYAAAGQRTIVLTVRDATGATATATRTVTLTAPNQAPTARIAVTESGMSATLDGRGSTDPDGTIAAYAWDFGDGTSGSGATATHPYASEGTYTVRLTVTDDDGATAQATATVRAAAGPPAGATAFDRFERSVASGWGSAEVGGAWSALGGTAAFSVAGGEGVIRLAPSHTREARLAGTQTSAVAEVSFSSDVLSAGGTASVTVIARQVGSNTYSGRVRLEPNGVIRLYLLRNETSLGTVVLPQQYTAGTDVHVRVMAAGTGPTALGASVWLDGQPRPTGWMLQATDTTAGLQSAGTVSIKAALSAASTNAQTVLRFDDWLVTPTP
ncbi:PKD domain-containing protein [Agrococcus terreus]|uniref:PKD domain-containing protein n=1 Tax=Agrococcus terreus TaxID=574649 RepID=UPI00385041A3